MSKTLLTTPPPTPPAAQLARFHKAACDAAAALAHGGADERVAALHSRGMAKRGLGDLRVSLQGSKQAYDGGFEGLCNAMTAVRLL
jgi:hypothetical protein